jgi:hypothetical protein
MNCYTTNSSRSANVIEANPRIYHHPTNPRLRVVARNAKQSLGFGRYCAVRVFYVKAKIGNKWVGRTPGTSKENAERLFDAPIPNFI